MQADKLPAGTLVANRYQILGLLGKGRAGAVYRAMDIKFERVVAFKILFETIEQADDTGFRRFEREARAAGSLCHPHIVTVFDFGLSSEGFPWLAMEYLGGTDLHTVVGTEGRLSVQRTLKIVTQITSALGHAHKRGLIHRDLKPSNIVLLQEDEWPDYVKVVDFGLAKRYNVDEDTLERLTAEGQVLGTPAYMSPEQCQGAKLDARADIYSLGCVVFKMLTGGTPIVGTSLIEVLQNHVREKPLSFADVNKDIMAPREVEAVVLKSLAKDPQSRQQSMAEFRAEFTAAFTGGEGAPSMVAMSGMSTAAGSSETTGLKDCAYAVVLDAANRGDIFAQFEASLRLERGDGVQADLDESHRWLRTAADNGLKDAQFKLGKQMVLGEDAQVKAPKEGARYLLLAAEQGYEPAETMIGQCYEEGNGVPQDYAEAIRWYRAAFNHGNRLVEQRLSLCYDKCKESGANAAGLGDWLAARAEEGDKEAMYSLASRFKGESNWPKYFENLHRAAQAGHLNAQLELAHACLFGQGTERKPDHAVYWFTQAAEQGSTQAMVRASACFKNGIGTQQDVPKAVAYLQKAVDENDLEARGLMGAALMTGDGVQRSMPRGIQMLKQAATEGGGYAQWKYALCLLNGLGCLRDLKEAEKWFEKAAELQFVQSVPWQTPGSGLDFSDALKQFQQMANARHRLAPYWLGICFELGLGTAANANSALEWYQRSASLNYQPAIDAVARLRAILGKQELPKSIVFGGQRPAGF